jgi:hypothetical protein
MDFARAQVVSGLILSQRHGGAKVRDDMITRRFQRSKYTKIIAEVRRHWTDDQMNTMTVALTKNSMAQTP